MSHIHNMVLVAVRYHPLYTNCVQGHSRRHQLFLHYDNKSRIHIQTCRLSHVVLVRSEELDTYGTVGIFYLCVPAVSLPCLENSFRRDEFRHHHIPSKIIADGAENGIRHSSHWSKEQGEIRFEEREGSGTVGKSHDSLG